MGELIVLPRTDRPVRIASSQESSAEILFFTGVRYYRMTEDEVAQAEKQQTKPRRRRRPRAAELCRDVRIEIHA